MALTTYRIQFIHGAIDGENDIIDVPAEQMEPIHNGSILEFTRTIMREDKEEEVIVRQVPLVNVVSIEPLRAEVLEGIQVPELAEVVAPALPPITEPDRMFIPADIQAGVARTVLPPPDNGFGR